MLVLHFQSKLKIPGEGLGSGRVRCSQIFPLLVKSGDAVLVKTGVCNCAMTVTKHTYKQYMEGERQ